MGSPTRPTIIAASLLLAAPTWAQESARAPSSTADQLEQAVLGGEWWLRLRYRLENVDQDGFDHEAWASTLRTVLGYETKTWHGASALLEFEDVSVVGNEQYDSTINGMTDYPVVADPEGAEVNQVFLRYVGEEGTARLGRQVLTLDNHRFVGDVGWRQNQQTFDAATVIWTPLEALDVHYSFLDNADRVFGDDSPQGDHRMSSHLVNAGYDVEGWGRLVGYAYLLDYDAVDVNSSDTFGSRFAGRHGLGGEAELSYVAEYATQADAADNPNDVDQDYFLGELGAGRRGWSLRAGYEELGGSGAPGDAFQTPLATLHSFNGWADKFLVTPDTGLEDSYLALGGKAGDFDLQVAWHDFQLDSGSLDYGSELDASLVWAAPRAFTVGLKFADYQADDFATDTTKTWLWVAYAP